MTPYHIGDPVFADRTGRRHRLFTLTGTAGGLALAAAVLVLLAAFTGAGPAALPGWDDTTTTPRPSRSAAAKPAPAPRSTSVRPPAAPATAPPPPARTSATPTPSVTATTATPTPTVKGKGKDRRRVPTHTPSARPPRKP
jgi:hypothetical protein